MSRRRRDTSPLRMGGLLANQGQAETTVLGADGVGLLSIAKFPLFAEGRNCLGGFCSGRLGAMK